VNYGLKGQGSTDWCTYTTRHVNAFSAIVLDNLIVSDPTIQQAICGGQTQISGNFTTDTAKQLATYLNYGALPVALHVDSSQEVSASLGPQYVRDAYIAGIIGFIIVALFMLIYYRLPGALAVVALLMYAAVTFAAYKLVGVTITLAGIAGFILSIGMAVDANVLIFERMREELRAGKTLGAAVDSGFRRAFPSIRDSNASTIITTIILYVFGHNFAATTITGFALTLGIGVAISFITAVYVSHTFLRLVVISGRAREASYYGVDTLAGGRASA
jgi:preprotein translocase subunit SecD